MEEADKDWMTIKIGQWVNVSSGTGSPGWFPTKGRGGGGGGGRPRL